MNGLYPSLEKIIEGVSHLKQVYKSDLRFGDLIVITTRNSVYSIFILDNNFCLVSGGWFDRQGLSPMKVSISGCTWGGRIIKADILAACGLRLEFGNRVITTNIQKVYIIRSNIKN